MTAPRAREQAGPPSPPERRPPRRGGGSSPSPYTCASAAGRPAGPARLCGARRGLVRSARALAAAALLVLSGALALPAPAQAQTVTTLVSNLNQDITTRDASNPRAQGFTIGSNPAGYILKSVDVVSADSGASTFTAEVCTTDSNELPTSDCTTLTPPGSFAAGTLSFTAPTGDDFVLKGSGKVYSVVLRPGSDNVTFSVTNNDSEDMGKEEGWSIANNYDFWNTTADAWSGTGSQSLRIAVKGYRVPAPQLQAVETNSSGTVLELSFSRDINGDNPPPASAFRVNVDGSPLSIDRVLVGGDVVLRISPDILTGQTVTLSYTDPTSGDDTNALQDDDGADVVTFVTGQDDVPAVVNRSNVNPTPDRAEVSTDGTTINLRFPKDLDHVATYSATIRNAFTVTVDGDENQVESFSGSGRNATLTMSSVIGTDNAVVVSYDQSEASTEAFVYPGGSLLVPDFTTGSGGVPAVDNKSTLDAPDAPTGLTATVLGATIVDLAWTAPADDGGSAITGYRVEVSDDGSTGSWSDLVADTGSTDTEYSHTGLSVGQTRHYRVSAINAVGTSDASVSDSATTQRTAPDPPEASAIADGTSKIVVSWRAPANDGGSAITGYRLQVSSTGASGWSNLVQNTTDTSHDPYRAFGRHDAPLPGLREERPGRIAALRRGLRHDAAGRHELHRGAGRPLVRRGDGGVAYRRLIRRVRVRGCIGHFVHVRYRRPVRRDVPGGNQQLHD